MYKIFVSQCMKDVPDSEIVNILKQIKEDKEIRERYGEFEIIDSYIPEFVNDNIKNKSVAYLGKSISKLAEADVALFVSGWEECRGCKIEHEIAEKYGIEIMYYMR